MNASALRARMRELKEKHHGSCYFYSNPFEVDIEFGNEGSLTGSFLVADRYQGYDGRIHGGILSALIDHLMTVCLFANGIVAYTVRLNIRYSHPVEIGKNAAIRIWIEETGPKIVSLRAEILQDGLKRVTAYAKFITDPGG